MDPALPSSGVCVWNTNTLCGFNLLNALNRDSWLQEAAANMKPDAPGSVSPSLIYEWMLRSGAWRPRTRATAVFVQLWSPNSIRRSGGPDLRSEEGKHHRPPDESTLSRR